MLGILLMNAVSFKFGPAPYFNLSASGSDSWLDWAVGIIGEVIVDQKFMGLFSLLFGAGMILFIDRAQQERKARSRADLWRNALLLLIGILHSLLWFGVEATADICCFDGLRTRTSQRESGTRAQADSTRARALRMRCGESRWKSWRQRCASSAFSGPRTSTEETRPRRTTW